jgi:hypothetical protein
MEKPFQSIMHEDARVTHSFKVLIIITDATVMSLTVVVENLGMMNS